MFGNQLLGCFFANNYVFELYLWFLIACDFFHGITYHDGLPEGIELAFGEGGRDDEAIGLE